MKKFLLAFFATIFLMLSFNIKAEAKSYEIDSLLINAKITEEGNIEVEEELGYNFHGQFNGIYRTLNKKGCDGYEVSSIEIKDKNGKLVSLKQNNDSSENYYELNDSSDKLKIKIFNKNQDENKKFILKYTVLNAAKRYNDFCELNWSFYNVENEIHVKKVDLNLSLKDEKYNMDNFKCKVYADEGRFDNEYNDNNIHLYGDNLTSLLGVKVQFQPEFIRKEPEVYKDISLDDEDNDDGIFKYIALGTLGLTAIFSIIYIQKLKKRKKAIKKYREEFEFLNEELLEEAPSDISPFMVNLLYNEKYISNLVNLIPSAMFYLCERNVYTKSVIKLSKNDEEEEILCFKKIENAEKKLDKHLIYFIKWMDLYKKDGVITFENISENIETDEGNAVFLENASKLEHIVKKEAKEKGYYVSINKHNILSNESLNEKLKWVAYKKYILKCIDESENLYETLDIKKALIYMSALEIDDVNEELMKKTNMDNQNILFLAQLAIFNDINSSQNNASSISSPSTFTGGGGGGSGAF